MKKMLIFLSVLMCLLFSGCARTEYPLPLHQPLENISSIELSDHTSGERVILKLLTDGDIYPFAVEMQHLQCFRYINDPPVENGFLTIYIYYKNGDIDILGTDICDAESSENYHEGWYYIEPKGMWELFSNYVEHSQLPMR